MSSKMRPSIFAGILLILAIIVLINTISQTAKTVQLTRDVAILRFELEAQRSGHR
jgi:hypothetical protein